MKSRQLLPTRKTLSSFLEVLTWPVTRCFHQNVGRCFIMSPWRPKRCLIDDGFCLFSVRRTEVLPEGVPRCGWEIRPPPPRRVAYSTEPLHKQENQTFRPHYANRVTHQASKARPVELTRQNSNVKSLISVSPPPYVIILLFFHLASSQFIFLGCESFVFLLNFFITLKDSPLPCIFSGLGDKIRLSQGCTIHKWTGDTVDLEYHCETVACDKKPLTEICGWSFAF